jgi:hypothetical protein
MLNIDQKQYDALMAAMRSAFKRRLAAHVKQHSPVYAAAIGESGVAALVDMALARSLNRGYKADGDAVPWLNLMMQLGVAFDEDPLLPWGGKLPPAADAANPSSGLQAIQDTAEAYLAKLAGEEGDRLAAAIGRFLKASPQELIVEPSKSSDLLANALAGLYPEKYQATDYPALQAFMQGTIARCLKAGINVKEKIVLLMLFDFMLGWEASTSAVFAPSLANSGGLTLVDIPLPELLQRMKTLMQGLLAAPVKGR